MERTKFTLDEDRIPRAFYNIAADLPEPPPPPLHPGTGQPIQFMAIDIHRLQDGQIVETWHIEDFLSVLFQIGASIQPGSTAAATPTV